MVSYKEKFGNTKVTPRFRVHTGSHENEHPPKQIETMKKRDEWIRYQNTDGTGHAAGRNRPHAAGDKTRYENDDDNDIRY